MDTLVAFLLFMIVVGILMWLIYEKMWHMD
jgi:hypothetical protein